MTTSFEVNTHDLTFILKQIKVAELQANGVQSDGTGYTTVEAIMEVYGVSAADAALLPVGLRTVDGYDNNLLAGRESTGAAHTEFPRLTDPKYVTDAEGSISFGPNVIINGNYTPTADGTGMSVVDTAPRIISNLIVDQTAANPAAIYAALKGVGITGAPANAAVVDISVAYRNTLNANGASADVTAKQLVVNAELLQHLEANDADLAADAAVERFTAADALDDAASLAASEAQAAVDALVTELNAAGPNAQSLYDAAVAAAVAAVSTAGAVVTALGSNGTSATQATLGGATSLLEALTALNIDTSIDGVDAVPAAAAASAYETTSGTTAQASVAAITAGLAAAQADAGLTQAALNAATVDLDAAQAALSAAVTAAGTTGTPAQAAAALAAVIASYGIETGPEGGLVIENVSPDVGLTPSFNSFMTIFGQFFDHGLDLVNKGGNGTVYIPLEADDPLIAGADKVFGTADDLAPNLRFMAMTRATQTVNVNPDGSLRYDHTNATTSFVDQNQTYTSHASHQAFLREYVRVDLGNGTAETRATGALLDGRAATGSLDGAVASWADTKAHALEMLGIRLTDADVERVPLLRTDAYGNLVLGANGYALMAMEGGGYQEGTAAGISTFGSVAAGPAFLVDIAHHAAPGRYDSNNDGRITTADAFKTADTDSGVNDDGLASTYDDEMLNAHIVSGDGRGNENIALTSMHAIFHSEHNRILEENKHTILESGDLAFINEWLLVDLPEGTNPATVNPDSLVWDGDRMFQAARFTTEMQYQHMVFEEFARRISPAVDPFVFTNTADIDPSILAEFAHTVYRFGHSMLTDTVDRLDADLTTVNGDANQMSLIEAFLNPQGFTSTANNLADAQAALIRGLTSDVGAEIDEFIVPALQSNLLGLPLDLAALNIARGRDTGVLSLNDTRAQLYNDFAIPDLKPYASWNEFTQNIKNPLSVINFIAAYGNHATIVAADTLEERRDAASKLLFGGNGAPEDRLDFLNGRGVYGPGNDRGGLDNIDLWIGGLAEKVQEFGGMLGATFGFIFEYQMESLQNGDRFYYLSRTQGLNLLDALEANTFADIVMRNSSLSDAHATHLSGNLFLTPDMILELDRGIAQRDYNGDAAGGDPTWDDGTLQSFSPKVERDYSNSTSLGGHDYGGVLNFRGGEHVVLGGTEGNDTLTSDLGDDTLWGDGGDDYLNGAAGADQVFGGDGDDIIEDLLGDNFLRGERGNDVISSARGLNILFGGEGQDAVFMGQDASEAFGGGGNDFILGGAGGDTILGNEGDDWLEGGEGFDGISGDNSELFFNSTIIGHDVAWGQGNDQDYDLESGDDIALSGIGIQRFEGMFGFDWASAKYDVAGVNWDLMTPVFTTDPADILRDRFDLMEGMSGWKYNDRMTGDNRGTAAGALDPILDFDNHVLTQEGIDRIAGLNDWLAGARATLFGAGVTTYRDGNIIMGGDGSDYITGRGGFDLIDGDSWLNVRIKIVVDGTTYSAESLNSAQTTAGALSGKVFNTDTQGNPIFTSVAFGGRSLTSLLLDRTINPGEMSIVREILQDTTPGDIDTAAFSGSLDEYIIEGRGMRIDIDGDGNFVGDENLIRAAYDVNGDGFISVIDQGGPGRNNLGDDTDLVRNIELLAFANNQTVAVNTPMGIVRELNFDPTLLPSAIPATVGTTLGTISSDGIAGVFSLGAGSSPGVALDSIGNLSVAGPLGLNSTHLVNVVFSAFGLSSTETLTLRTGSSIANSITGAAGDDIVYANGGNDTLAGAAGNDVLFGQSGTDSLDGGVGNDVLIGGIGNDVIIGGTGNDRIIYRFGDGTDLVDGGTGTDILEIRGTAANETLNLRWDGTAITAITGTSSLAGIELINVDLMGASDTLAYTANSSAVTVDLGAGTASGLASFAQIANVTGGNGADRLTGDAQANRLSGGAGADTLLATVDDLRDVYLGGTGTDLVDYSAYSTGLTVNLAVATAIVVGSGSEAALSDTVNAIENLTGGSGADTFLGSTAINTLRGGEGADSLSGNGGNDILFGGDGDDILNGGSGQDQLTGGAGADTFFFALTSDSTTTAPDRIFDFEGAGSVGGDLIDIGNAAGDDFVFIGAGPFATGGSNQVRVTNDGTNTFVDLDTDNDTGFEARIRLDGLHSLSSSDFIL